MDSTQTHALIEKAWSDSILAELIDYIRIPNRSPAFDPHWQEHGYMEEAIAQFERWARTQAIEGMTVEVVRLSGRTPLLFIDIPGPSQEGVLLYGHLDKQPEMTGWRSGLGPWEPVLEGDRLYGRGAADDGYVWSSSRPARRAAVLICPLTSTPWGSASAIRAWSFASIPAAETMISSGARPRCGAWREACSRWRS
jgi:hypothetical protein